MQKTNNLQDLFLLRARKTRAAVTVFLMNGYQLRGQITGFHFPEKLDEDRLILRLKRLSAKKG